MKVTGAGLKPSDETSVQSLSYYLWPMLQYVKECMLSYDIHWSSILMVKIVGQKVDHQEVIEPIFLKHQCWDSNPKPCDEASVLPQCYQHSAKA